MNVFIRTSRAIAAYVYSASGYGESTTDLAWDGQGVIYEMGDLLAQSTRFDRKGELCVVDIDTERLAAERMRNQTFADASPSWGWGGWARRGVGEGTWGLWLRLQDRKGVAVPQISLGTDAGTGGR